MSNMIQTGSFEYKELCDHNPKLYDEVIDFLSSLPQAEAIKEEDALKWMEKTASLTVRGGSDEELKDKAIEQLWWHLKRLEGLGGSDIGDAISRRVGELPGFNTPDELFKAKRMVYAPTNGDNYTRRGTLLEPILGQMLLEDFELERSQETIDKVHGNSGKVEGYEFLVGNIDEAVIDADGNTFILDYKAPSVIPAEPPFAYVAQLHHYDIILNDGQMGDNYLADAFFDYSKGELIVHQVKKDEELLQNIKEYGKEFWSLVTDPSIDALPSIWKETEELIEGELTEEDVSNFSKINSKLKTIKVLEESLKEAKEELAVMADTTLTSQYGLKEGAKDLCKDLTVKVSLKTTNELELTRLLESKGVNPKSLMVKRNSYDKDKITELLIDLGKDPDDFKSEGYDGNKVLDKLRELGVAEHDYIVKSSSVYPKNSKAVKEEISQIKESVSGPFRKSIDDTLEMIYEEVLEESMEN